MSLAHRLREANQAVWDEMQAHRFVRDIEANALPRAVFLRYVVYEHEFVETAILIFGHALLRAPDFAARRFLCGVLHGLGGAQLDYFDAVFAALGVTSRGTLPASVTAFDRGMLRIAEGGDYLDIMTIMLAAEWMYATWCGRAAKTALSDPAIADWVRLHAEPAFLAQAQFLRAQLDKNGADIDASRFARLSGLFGKALRLEIDFHTAPYEGVAA